LEDHFLKIKDIRDQLKSNYRTMEKKDMVVLTLRSLPSFYANFIKTLNITHTDKELTFEKLSTKLLPPNKWKKKFGNSYGIEPFEVVLAMNFKCYSINFHHICIDDFVGLFLVLLADIISLYLL